MSHSDRSRSPTRRSGSTLTRADLPGFPIWRGPMGQAIRTVSNPQHNQQWPGAYHMHSSQTQVRPFSHSAPPPSQPFPPTPFTYRPPTFVTSTPHPPSIPASQPSQPLSFHSTLSTDSSSAQQPFTPLFRLTLGLHPGFCEHPYVFHTSSHLHL